MLTSSNQYLRPDYLTPLPTTLDAKKSPLALLAQTCSAIGADTPNPKLVSAAERASAKGGHKHEGGRERSPPAAPPAHDSKPSFKPYESCLTARDKTRTPEERGGSAHPRTPLSSKGSAAGTPAPAPGPPPAPRCASNQSCSSRASPSAHRKTPSERSEGRPSPTRDSPAPARPGDSGKTAFAAPASSADVKDSPSSFKPSAPATSSAFLGALPGGGFPLHVDLMTSSLMAAQHHALKSGLNPYLAYARMKAPGGGGGELGACRDPYCTGCSLSAHLLKAACPAGCAHCDHAKAPFLGGHPAAAAYAHAQLAALAAASQLPYVCSWIGGEAAYCGKRFASSDELLQHLRSHTAGGEGAGGAGLALLGAHPLLQRSYPTPPLSPLTPRFHPYGKPASAAAQLGPPQLPFPLPPHPSLAAYFPSYPLFGPRALHP